MRDPIAARSAALRRVRGVTAAAPVVAPVPPLVGLRSTAPPPPASPAPAAAPAVVQSAPPVVVSASS